MASEEERETTSIKVRPSLWKDFKNREKKHE